MKDIKKRQRQFLAGLLAFILAMLPAVSVWAAQTYNVNYISNNDLGSEKGGNLVNPAKNNDQLIVTLVGIDGSMVAKD